MSWRSIFLCRKFFNFFKIHILRTSWRCLKDHAEFSFSNILEENESLKSLNSVRNIPEGEISTIKYCGH